MFGFQVETIEEDLAMLDDLLIKVYPTEEEKKQIEKNTQSIKEDYAKHVRKDYIQWVDDAEYQSGCFGRKTYLEYMNELTDTEIDLLYTAYYQDFKLFGYEPWE